MLKLRQRLIDKHLPRVITITCILIDKFITDIIITSSGQSYCKVGKEKDRRKEVGE